jgi:hypothetical protein
MLSSNCTSAAKYGFELCKGKDNTRHDFDRTVKTNLTLSDSTRQARCHSISYVAIMSGIGAPIKGFLYGRYKSVRILSARYC